MLTIQASHDENSSSDKPDTSRDKQPPSSNKLPVGVSPLKQLSGHSDSISRIAWSPDGRWLASASRDKSVRVWDVSKGIVRHILNGHTGWVIDLAWSPDSSKLVSCADDRMAKIWDASTGQVVRTLAGHDGTIKAVAWSPDGKLIATGSEDKTIWLWKADTGEKHYTVPGHTGGVFSLDWSPDGRYLASGSDDSTVRLWHIGPETARTRRILHGHSQAVYSVKWSPEGEMIATCSNDKTARVWDAKTGRDLTVLEGHTNGLNDLAYSWNGGLLASKADNVRLWRTDIWDQVACIPEPDAGVWPPGIAFHPTRPILATLGNKENDIIRLWELDVAVILNSSPKSKSVQYSNAKVVLLGDTGVGKSGLGLVLTGHPFAATDSTHGRHVWSLDVSTVEVKQGRRETREILLWDMAGQPGYRLVHQLYLSEVTVALVLVDSRSETDPFAGARHWARALAQAEKVQGAQRIVKILVAARCDRGSLAVSRDAINKFMQEMGFDHYVETSAKEGTGIDELGDKVTAAIAWEKLPKVSSPQLFQLIKDFLLAEKQKGRILSSVDDLYRAFVQAHYPTKGPSKTLRSNFEACLARVQSRGLIQLLSFGDLVLLQPELLDAYASALINAARSEPQGLGCMSLKAAQSGNFTMPSDFRLKNRSQEHLLLLATIEHLLGHEIALKVDTDHAEHIVFPSQFTREHPSMPEPQGKSVVFHFKGAVLNAYTTLVVRLSHSGVFTFDDMWKNAVTYTSKVGGSYGLYLDERGEGEAKLILFFDGQAPEVTRYQFEHFVETHLQRHAIPGSLERERIFACPKCRVQVQPAAIAKRREMNHNFIMCNVCDDVRISLLDGRERITQTVEIVVGLMDRNADEAREANVAAASIEGKQHTGHYDVFLSYNSKNRAEVRAIYEQLKAKGISAWLDEEELQPGKVWPSQLEDQIQKAKAAAVFIGEPGLGRWQKQEELGILIAFNDRDDGIIPVILPSCKEPEPKLPLFLKARTWVDFRVQSPDPLERLIWGIKGKKDKDIGGPQK